MTTITDRLATNDVSLMIALATLAIIAGAFITIILLNRLLARSLTRLEQRLSLPYESLLTIGRLMKGLVWLIAAMLILSLWGVSVGGLWALLVSAATVIGVGFLAVWTMISNVTASLFITIWRPFQFGHTIELLPENLKGRVIDRNMMFTILREEGGARLHVPNNLFFQKMFRVSGREDLSQFEALEGHDG